MEAVKTTWKVDPTHSEVLFKVKHLVISTVTGHFNKYDVTIHTAEDDFEQAEAYFEAEVDGISTNNEQRDQHLKSDDFFNASEFPKITFRSTAIKKADQNQYKLTGILQIREVEKEVELDVEAGGVAVDPWGNTRAGFEIQGTINRKEFNLKWDTLTEAGGAVVGDQVKLLINIQLVKSN